MVVFDFNYLFVYNCILARQFESTTTDIKFLNVLLVSISPLFSLNGLRSHEIYVHYADLKLYMQPLGSPVGRIFSLALTFHVFEIRDDIII